MTQTENFPLLLSASEINRELFRVNPRTLKRWHAAGKIEALLVNGKWRFNRESLLAYLSGSPPAPAESVIPAAKRAPGRPRIKEATK